MKYSLPLVLASSTVVPFIYAQETLPEDLRASIEEDSTQIQVSYVGNASDGFDDATVFNPDGKFIALVMSFPHGIFDVILSHQSSRNAKPS